MVNKKLQEEFEEEILKSSTCCSYCRILILSFIEQKVEQAKQEGRAEADWHGEKLLDAIESGKKQERENWELILDSDSCECDNCHRTRRYLRNPKKELHKVKQKAEAKNKIN